MKKYIYSFDETAHGNTESAQLLLGNKGAQLSEMISIGLPVPHGFTISTEACKEFYSLNKKWPSGLREQLLEKVWGYDSKLNEFLYLFYYCFAVFFGIRHGFVHIDFVPISTNAAA